MKSMSDKIKKSRFVTIERAGHISPVEAPKKFNEEIEKFLDQ